MSPRLASPRQPLRLNVVGMGHVGRALVELIAERPALAGRVQIVSVTDSSGTHRSRDALDPRVLLASKRSTGRASPASERIPLEAVAGEFEGDVLVDLLPTDLTNGEPSRTLALAALRAGKHVVTANKGVLALHFAEVTDAARLAGREVLGSATVCAGTPVLETLRGAFRGDRVERIEGVLNGSTNFVLSRLEAGEDWDGALAGARKLGILEANPSLDLMGLDAAAKAVILANHAYPVPRSLPDARVEGVWGITAREALDARAHGLAIRLVARADLGAGISVAPVALPREHPLVVEGAENVVRIKTEAAGLITLRGPGAGGRESAAGVLSDILSLGSPR